MEEVNDHNVYHSSTEEPPVKAGLPANKNATPNLTNGPNVSILPKDAHISNGPVTSNGEEEPVASSQISHSNVEGMKDGIKDLEVTLSNGSPSPAETSSVTNMENSLSNGSPPPSEMSSVANMENSLSNGSPPPAEISSVANMENSLANSECDIEHISTGNFSQVSEARTGTVVSARHSPGEGDGAGQNTQTSFVNEFALASTGISSQKDGDQRDCNSNREQLYETDREDEHRFGEERDGNLDQDQDGDLDLDQKMRDTYQDQRDMSRELDQTERDSDQNGRDRDASEDRGLEQFSEILLDSDLSGSEEDDTEPGASVAGASSQSAETNTAPKKTKRVRFADEVAGANGAAHGHHKRPPAPSSLLPEVSPNAKLSDIPITPSPTSPKHKGPKQFSMLELINGVEMPAEYLGSTPIILGGTGTVKAARMYQAQQAVQLVKDPENESRPSFEVNVKISTAAIILADRATGLDLMDHPLHTITYVADIDRVLVIMAHILPTPISSPSTPTPPTPTGNSDAPGDESPLPSDGQGEVSSSYSSSYTPKLTCHVLDAPNARSIAMVIGQAFSAAYKQALRASGVKEEQLEQAEYAHILNAQSVPKLEVESLGDRNKTKKLTIAKHKNDIMGMMVIESGYGSAIPAPVIVHLSKAGSAARSGLLNVGDHILSINGINLVGMPRKTCIEQIRKCRPLNVVKMEVCSCPAVVDVAIVRPDLKFQLGFTVNEGMICSLMRGSIAERSGVRVGHRIIEINGTSTVGLPHSETVHLLSSTVGDLHIRTMSDVMFKLLTGKLQPEYY